MDIESKLSLAATARMAKHYEYGISREEGMSRLRQLYLLYQDEMDVNQSSNLLLQAKFVVDDAVALFNRNGAPIPDLDWRDEIDRNMQKRRDEEKRRMEQRIQALHREHDERDAAKNSKNSDSDSSIPPSSFASLDSMDLFDDGGNGDDDEKQLNIPPPQPQRVVQLIETETVNTLPMPDDEEEWEQIPDHLLPEVLGQAPDASRLASSRPEPPIFVARRSEIKNVPRATMSRSINNNKRKRKRSEYDTDDDGSEPDTSGSDNACGVDDFDFQGDENDQVTLTSSDSDSDSDRITSRPRRGRPSKGTSMNKFVNKSKRRDEFTSARPSSLPKPRLDENKESKQAPRGSDVKSKETEMNISKKPTMKPARKPRRDRPSPSPSPESLLKSVAVAGSGSSSRPSTHSGSDSGDNSEGRKLRRHSSVGYQIWRRPNDFTAHDINREQLRHEACKAQLVGFELKELQIGTEVQWDESAPAHLELPPGARQKCSGLVVAFTETHVYVRVPTLVRLASPGLDHCISKRRSAGVGGVRLVTCSSNRNCVKPFGRIGPYKVDIRCNQPICALVDGPAYGPLADEAAFLDKCVFVDNGPILMQSKGRFAVTRNTILTNGTMDIVLEKHSKDILLQAVRWDLIPLVQRILSYTENQDKTSATLSVLIEVAIYKPLTVTINTRSFSKEERTWAHGQDYSLPSVLLWMLQHEPLCKWVDLRAACLGFDSELCGRILSSNGTNSGTSSVTAASMDSPRPWQMADLLSESICPDSTSARYRLKTNKGIEKFGQLCGVRIQLKDYQVETIKRMREMEQTSRSSMRPFWFPLTMVKSHLRTNQCVFVSPYFQKFYIPEYDGYTTCGLAVGKKDRITEKLLAPLPDMRGGYNAEEQRIGKTIEIISLAFLNRPRQDQLLERTSARTSANANAKANTSTSAKAKSTKRTDAKNGKDEKKYYSSDSESDSIKHVKTRKLVVKNSGHTAIVDDDDDSEDDANDGDADDDSDDDRDLEPRMINGKPLIKATLVIVTPKTLVQWNAEITKVSLSGSLYQRRVLQFYGQGAKAKDIDKRIQTADIILTTYKTLHTESPHAKLLLKYAFWRLVLDEVHTVGKTTTNIFEFIKNIARKHYWPLSGTYVDKSVEKDLYGPMSLFNIPGFDRAYFHNVAQVISGKGSGFQLKQDIGPYVMLPLIMAFRRLFIRHAWLQPYNGRPQLAQGSSTTLVPGQNVASIKERIIRVDFSSQRQRQVYALLLHKATRSIDAFELGRGNGDERITRAMKSLEHACSFGNFDLGQLKRDESDVINSTCKLTIDVKSTEEAYGDENDGCAVCMQKKRQRPCQTPCNHVFCQACLELSIEFDGKCPLCRIELDPKKLRLPKFKKKSSGNADSVATVRMAKTTSVNQEKLEKASSSSSRTFSSRNPNKKKRRKLNREASEDDLDFRAFMPSSLLKKPTEASKRVLRSQISASERAPRQVLKSTYSASHSDTEQEHAQDESDSGSVSDSDSDSARDETESSESESETVDNKNIGQNLSSDACARMDLDKDQNQEEQDQEEQVDDVCMNPKYAPLVKRLVKLHRRGEKAVVFTKNRLALMNLAREISRQKMRYMSQTESTTALQFGKQMEHFNNDKRVCAMLLTYRAGSNGINLQKANHVVMFDPADKAAEDAQALFRVVHTDKAHTVNVYRYIVRHSIEESALEELLSAKTRLLSNVAGLVTPMDMDQDKSYDDHASTKKQRFIAEMRKRLATSLTHLDISDIVT